MPEPLALTYVIIARIHCIYKVFGKIFRVSFNSLTSGGTGKTYALMPLTVGEVVHFGVHFF